MITEEQTQAAIHKVREAMRKIKLEEAKAKQRDLGDVSKKDSHP